MTGGNTVLRLGTRGSPLALVQAREARGRIARAHGWSDDAVEIAVIRTTGDAIQDRPLAEAGGKGLFTRELDIALVAGDIDLAVHSAKDLPTILPPDILLLGYLPREDVRDALISPRASGLGALAQGARVGSASLRRQAQLRRVRPDLRVELLRGNVETRLRKVDDGGFEATVLALAGLTRLGLAHRASAVLGTDEFLPAVGQGAIAITVPRHDREVAARIAPALDLPTGVALACERAFLAILDGSCRTPIAGHARIEGHALTFRGLVLSPDGTQCVETLARGPMEDAARLGAAAGADLLARAPPSLLRSFREAGQPA